MGLSSKEFDLLVYFIEQEAVVVTIEQIYQAVWKTPYINTDNALRGCLERLRKAISPGKYSIKYLRGKEKGYCFERR